MNASQDNADDRQVAGHVTVTVEQLVAETGLPPDEVRENIDVLVRDGFLWPDPWGTGWFLTFPEGTP